MAMPVTTFETGLGNDVIDGGSGTDTVKLSGNYSSYQITHNALENKFTISGSNETKQLPMSNSLTLMMYHTLEMS